MLAGGVSSPATATEIEDRSDLNSLFKDHGAVGTFALYDVAANKLTVIDRVRAETRFVPASTFKIANSLIALETAVVKDENEVIPYGGKPQPFKQWEKDMPMREAIAVSNVPVYQELARRIGLERYRSWLDRLDYGNRQTGMIVDRFWLDGPLQISAVEEARFNARLAQKALPASTRPQEIVRDILLIEKTAHFALYAKTGWSTASTPNIGWWSGWVERGDTIFAFALNIDMADIEGGKKRMPLARAILVKLGIL